ncbi:TKL/TKL-ccin protein kinase [Rhodotorula toruloides ATCC 204091]|uniref:TKL/TKL-ccin protein kinase n=1 Tax=Rhodotorula toruloides TaxID=5286 RepID=A0A0K3CL12_RHOTO|nr:TKL/TKL-ccin protein kinase [Rhodotorula toruloides ATCC 204091]PRQ73689.1 TKL/TKL-ccin protein kinase [Rhodotorula toruloides]
MPALRSRKRQKVGSSMRTARSFNPDRVDEDDANDTDSDWEDQMEHERAETSARGGAAVDRSRRASAPSGSSRSAMATRRSSLPQRREGSQRTRAADPRARGPRGGKEDSGITQQPRTTRTGRTQHPLSPLPVNHSVERSYFPVTEKTVKGKGKERAVEEDAAMPPPRRRRDGSVPAQAARVTRRTSGGPVAPSSMGEPSRTTRRRSRSIVEEDEDEDEEMVTDDAPRRRLRSNSRTSLEAISDAEEAADGDHDDEAAVWEEEEDEEGGRASDDDDDDAMLHNWTADQLRTLRVIDLSNLFHRLPASSTSSAAPPRLKEEYIRAIIAARRPEGSSDDGEDEADSPLPKTSHEGSPEASQPRRRRSSSKVLSSRGADAKPVVRKKLVKRRSGARQQEPTPPPSDEAVSEVSEDDVEDTEVEEDEVAPQAEPEPAAASTRMARRASEVEMPPPPVPRRHVRTRSDMTHVVPPSFRAPSGPSGSGSNVAAGVKGRLLNGLQVNVTHDVFTSPVAHRTRGQQPQPPRPPQTRPTRTSPDAPAPGAHSPRPLRLAKRKVVARITKVDKGKGRADDGDEEMHDGDADIILGSDSGSEAEESDEVEEESAAAGSSSQPRRQRSGSKRDPVGRRRSARTAKQVETPPSDADEESGGETEREDSRSQLAGADSDSDAASVHMTSHLRHDGRNKRDGKVVRLRRGKKRQAAGRDGEDERMANDSDEEPHEDEDYEEADEEEQDEDEIDLATATSTTLNRYRKDDLVRLCEERELDKEGTKPQLIKALLEWRDKDVDASSPASIASSGSTVSNVSTETARGETKTQALNAVGHASNRTSGAKTPLLMRPDHSASPEKPQTPEHSKEHEHQEDVNTLDLESLQLQDKEIQPDKLTRLERIGSGGFKDVYKGKFRNRTIAICDIRGHLTDMDIKELGLLRDLRHTNIVQFIGVSIPKQPSPIPVMIITELCANGDLFDYIRKTDPPPFTAMLEILLGLSRGIEYLHLRKPTIIHRDIKSSNVLITHDGVAKIADFGLARIKTSTKSMIRSLVGTVNWQAPELWSPHPRYNEKVDVYSAGLVFWEVLQWHQAVKRYPFEGQNEHAIYHDVGAKQIRPPAGPLRRQWGSEIVDLMTTMWEQDPAQRPSMSHVVKELEKLISAEKAKAREAARRG